MAWGLAIGAGMGLLQNEEQQKQNNLMNQMNAIKERYSPWTHEHGTITPAENPFKAILQYGTTGGQIANALKNQSGWGPVGGNNVNLTMPKVGDSALGSEY